jgi:two-component system nitrogen regulation sensor histidine kinase NtrY
MTLLVTITPLLFVSTITYIYYEIGIESLFSDQMTRVVNQSVVVAEEYVKEHRNHALLDVMQIAKRIEHNKFALLDDPTQWPILLDNMADIQKLSEIVVFTPDRIVSKNTFSLSLAFEKLPFEELVDIGYDPVLIHTTDDQKVRAVVKLQIAGFGDSYLMVSKYLSPEILGYLKSTRGSADLFQSQMQEIDNTKMKLQIMFLIMYLIITALSVIAAVKLSKFIIGPINNLVFATERIKKGDLSVRVPEKDGRDETAILTRAFNKMISTLQKQAIELAAAQRASAWADVARRIAHEIKNPLTPIILSTQRLEKKFGGQIVENKEVFENYIATILKHVTDIGKIVEQFDSFAKLPSPMLKKNDLMKIVKQAVFSAENTYRNIECKLESPFEDCLVLCDETQISQVLINLIKNSAESIKSRLEAGRDEFNGLIAISLKRDKEYVVINIADNGGGISDEILERIFEPYVTSKPKGTGLGLSIVKKIIEEHGGEIDIRSVEKGAIVSFTLKLFEN